MAVTFNISPASLPLEAPIKTMEEWVAYVVDNFTDPNIYRLYKSHMQSMDFPSPSKILIWNLFGGKERYESLPVLDPGSVKIGPTDYLSIRDYSHITAPLMRGSDEDNREFIVIRAKKDSGTFVHHIFFQRYTHDDYNWSDSGFIFLMHGHLITNCHIKDFATEDYGRLKELISTGRIEGYTLA